MVSCMYVSHTLSMSIYSTLWTLQFPRRGDDYIGCDWIQVTAQAVPPHIGTPTVGQGYESGDPYGSFLPPPVETDVDGQAEFMRAVVIVTAETEKGHAAMRPGICRPLDDADRT